MITYPFQAHVLVFCRGCKTDDNKHICSQTGERSGSPFESVDWNKADRMRAIQSRLRMARRFHQIHEPDPTSIWSCKEEAALMCVLTSSKHEVEIYTLENNQIVEIKLDELAEIGT